MIFVLALQQASLADPPSSSTIEAAAIWLSGLLFGPLVTMVAVIAVAWLGLAMLWGRIDIRRGLAVVFGCFLLFGARGIADGLRGSATGDAVQQAASVPPPPVFPKPAPARDGGSYDPYAGAAVLRAAP